MNNNGEDEYRKATKEVVDNTMRIDVLGPYVVKVLCEHTPTGVQLRQMIVEAITNDSAVQNAFADFIRENKIKLRGQGLSKAQTAVVSAIGGLLLTVAGAVMTYFLLPPRG